MFGRVKAEFKSLLLGDGKSAYLALFGILLMQASLGISQAQSSGGIQTRRPTIVGSSKSASSPGTEMPLDLMGIRAGMRYPEVEEVVNEKLVPAGWGDAVGTEAPFQNHKACQNYNFNGPGVLTCSLIRHSGYGGYEHLVFNFVDDNLAVFLWLFNHEQFEEVSERLEKKYSAHSKLVKTQTTVQNQMGAVFPKRVFSWTNNTSTVILSEYGSTLELSNVTVAHSGYAAELRRRKPSAVPDL